jgi:hypothetical protein
MKGIFIGGMIKSGTSLVRRLIQSHEDVVSGLETYWFELFENYKVAGQKRGAGLIDQTEISDLSRLERLSVFYDIPLEKVLEIYRYEDTAIKFLQRFFGTVSDLHNKNAKIWVEKTPGNALYTDQIAKEKHTYIHVIRHPADVWYSCKRDSKFSSVSEFVDVYRGYQRPFDFIRDLNCKVIIYEQLIHRPHDVQTSLFEFLGLENYHENTTSLSDDGKELRLVEKVTNKQSKTLLRLEDPIDKNSIGTRNKLPACEKYQVEKELWEFIPENLIKTYGRDVV